MTVSRWDWTLFALNITTYQMYSCKHEWAVWHNSFPVCLIESNLTSELSHTHYLKPNFTWVRTEPSEFVVCYTSGQSWECVSGILHAVVLAAAAGLSCFPGSCSLNIYITYAPQSSQKTVLLRSKRILTHVIHSAPQTVYQVSNIKLICFPAHPWRHMRKSASY